MLPDVEPPSGLAELLAIFPKDIPFTITQTPAEGVAAPSHENGISIVYTGLAISVANEAVQFLVAKGFLINEVDLTSPTSIYWKLSDKGKDLQELGGDLEKYTRLMQLRKIKNEDLQTSKSNFVFWFRFIFGIGLAIAAIVQIGSFTTALQQLNPIDPPSPFSVCIWLFLLFLAGWMITRRRKPATAK